MLLAIVAIACFLAGVVVGRAEMWLRSHPLPWDGVERRKA